MQRKRHPDTVGGSDPDSGAAAPQALPQSAAGEPHVPPKVPVLRKRLPPPHTPEDLVGPKKRRVGPRAAPDLWVRPRNGSVSPDVDVGSPTDVGPNRGGDDERPEPEESGGAARRAPEPGPPEGQGEEEHPPRPKTHTETPKVPPGRGAEGTAPQRGGGGPQGGSGADDEEGGGADQELGVHSDTDVEEELNPKVPHLRDQRAPHVTPKGPNVGVETPNPDTKGPQIEGDQSLGVLSDTDIEEEELNPKVPHIRNQRAPHITPKVLTVVMETPNPDPKGPQSGGHQDLGVHSDTDIEEEELNPKVPHLRDQRAPHVTPKGPNVVMETPNPDPKGPQSGGGEDLGVHSDTDIEEELNPKVPRIRNQRAPHVTPKVLTVVMETPNPDPKGSQSGGHQSLGVHSDTDIEEEELNPKVPHIGNQRAPHITPKVLTVVMETPNPDPKGSQIEGDQSLGVHSDTDVEEELNPKVPPIRNQRAPHVTPKGRNVGVETPNPDPKGPQIEGDQSLGVHSDTDIEEEELNPKVPHPENHLKNQGTPHVTPKVLTVVMETPNPDPKGSQSRGGEDLGVHSDTDIEEEELNPKVPHLRDQRTPHVTPKVLTVVMETPNSDPKGSQIEGHQDLGVHRDTDVEEELNPKVPPIRNQRAPHITPKVLTVVMETPSPDPKGPQSGGGEDLGVHRDTDIEEELNPKVPPIGNQRAPHVTPKGPNVGVETPNPDPKGPQSGGGEELGVHRDTGAAAPEERLAAVGQHCPRGDAEVARCDAEDEDDAELFLAPTQSFLPPTQSFLPPTQSFLPPTQSFLPPTQSFLPPTQSFLPPTQSVLPPTQSVLPPTQSVLPPTQSVLPPTQSVLPPTQSFLPPTQSFPPPPAQDAVPTDTAPEWDPEEPTQCFCPPTEEEEEEEEEPPPSRVAAVAVPHEDSGTATARSEDVGEGQRRSQRRGSGASRAGGGAKAEGGGATADPAPLRRSPRLLARAPPEEPEKGRSHAEPRPQPASRPRRGHASSKKKAREEEPADTTRPKLRPRGGSASSPLKVLFTGVVASPEMEVALGSLGGSVAASVFDCTHLVTDRVRRTVKFLCAVARGIAIVTPKWIHESARRGRLLPPGPFVVRDGREERRFGFSLSGALGRARRRPLLQGYEVHVTPNVRPEPEQMRDIITCSGGTFLPSMPCTYGPRRLVISCPEDAGRWGPALGVRIPLLSAELLLTGLLRQQLQLQPFLLTPPGPPRDPPVSPRRLRDRTRRDPPGAQRCGRRGVQ